MTQPAKSQEPSMEEILASIRRIIADDDAIKSVTRPPPEPAKPEPAPPLASAPPAAPPSPSVLPTAAAPARPHVEPEMPPAIAEPEPSPVEGAASADPASDILDLTESMAASIPQAPAANAPGNAMSNPAPQFRTIDGDSDIGFEEASEAPAAPTEPLPAPASEDSGRLISNETSAAVDSAFNALAQTVLVQNARTLEDLVREMLRPLLKTWLDDNLPGTVERLVRAEIERVSRGRTG
jgi:uncharacterized protein